MSISVVRKYCKPVFPNPLERTCLKNIRFMTKIVFYVIFNFTKLNTTVNYGMLYTV